jgi:hypothetical protein
MSETQQAQTQSAQPVEQQEAPQPERPNISDVFKSFKDGPSSDQIDKWKGEFGEVYVSGFSEDELYLWRPLARPEYVELQSALQDPQQPMSTFQFEEAICERCVLWSSKVTSWGTGKAGTPAILSDQIMQNSNFLPPQAALMLVAKL